MELCVIAAMLAFSSPRSCFFAAAATILSCSAMNKTQQSTTEGAHKNVPSTLEVQASRDQTLLPREVHRGPFGAATVGIAARDPGDAHLSEAQPRGPCPRLRLAANRRMAGAHR